jgi:hypothetical protein
MKASGPAQLSRHSQAAPAKMAQWFEEALGLLPSSTECDKLTRRFQLLINRADNSEKLRDAHQKGRRLSPVDGDLKDASLDDFLGKRLESVHQAGKELLFRLAELEKVAGNYHWEGPSETISIEDLRHILVQIGVLVSANPETKAKPPRGQPPKAWHQVARKFAPEIAAVVRTLEREDAEKNANPQASGSATAIICSLALSWAYGENITAGAFVNALRTRSRKNSDKTPIASQRHTRIYQIKNGKLTPDSELEGMRRARMTILRTLSPAPRGSQARANHSPRMLSPRRRLRPSPRRWRRNFRMATASFGPLGWYFEVVRDSAERPALLRAPLSEALL